MFDLEQSIAEWRKQMLVAGIETPVPLEELEVHLCEDVEQRMRSGVSAKEAFDAAVQRIGPANVLTEEFKKIRGIIAPLAAAPPQLLAYTIFAVAVTFTDYLIQFFAPGPVRAWFVPYTGWVASMFYSFTIFFAFTLIYQRQKRSVMRFVGITLLMLCQVTIGISQIFQMGGETFGNPYLTISPWRPVWTILIPIIWIAVLHSPRMNRFCSKEWAERYV